jgi:hypothetical protein
MIYHETCREGPPPNAQQAFPAVLYSLTIKYIIVPKIHTKNTGRKKGDRALALIPL